MLTKPIIGLIAAAGVLAIGVTVTAVALNTAPSRDDVVVAAPGTSLAPSSEVSASAAPTPTPTTPTALPGDELVGDFDTDAEAPSDLPAASTPEPMPTAGPGEHVVTFEVTSSIGSAQVSYYTVGGEPSQSNSNLWVMGEQVDQLWVGTPWTHSAVIPAGGDPMVDGWGLHIFTNSGTSATCSVTMDGVVISSASMVAQGPTLWECDPGVVG